MFSLSLSSFPCGFFFSYFIFTFQIPFFLHNFMSKHSQAHHCIPEGHIGIIIIKLLKRLDKGWETAFERKKKKEDLLMDALMPLFANTLYISPPSEDELLHGRKGIYFLLVSLNQGWICQIGPLVLCLSHLLFEVLIL